MNVLWVTGVLRLEANDTKSAAAIHTKGAKHEEFDAWPSKEAKEKIQHAIRLADKYDYIMENEGELPDKWWEYASDASSDYDYADNDFESTNEEFE